jgi:hypothetical protein
MLLLNHIKTLRSVLDPNVTIHTSCGCLWLFPCILERPCLCCRADGSNALILPAAKKAGGAAAASAAAEVQQTLSKSQLKKLKQVQLKKQRREELTQVCLRPHSNSPAPEHTVVQPACITPAHARLKQHVAYTV